MAPMRLPMPQEHVAVNVARMSARASTRHFPDIDVAILAGHEADTPPTSARSGGRHAAAGRLRVDARALRVGRCGQQSFRLQWHAQLPHQGELSNLSEWWLQLNDPLLTRLD